MHQSLAPFHDCRWSFLGACASHGRPGGSRYALLCAIAVTGAIADAMAGRRPWMTAMVCGGRLRMLRFRLRQCSWMLKPTVRTVSVCTAGLLLLHCKYSAPSKERPVRAGISNPAVDFFPHKATIRHA